MASTEDALVGRLRGYRFPTEWVAERQRLLILGGLVAIGAALRFAALGGQSFGHDEAVTVGRILRPGLGATLREVPQSERTPYLYYVLAWLWTRVFGIGAVGVRSLSALRMLAVGVRRCPA